MAHELEQSPLDESALHEALAAMEGWSADGPAIRKTWIWPTFLDAVAFANRIALVAEKMNHHPNIEIRFKEVELRLTTHKCGCVTQADLKLAREIETVG